MRPIATDAATTALGDYRRYPGCRLLVVCGGCGWSKDYSPERVIARLSAFGDAVDLERKVREALGFLRDIEKGTLITSGLGETVSFVCNCGSTNKRRAGLLTHGQIVSCVNPDCIERWDVEIDGADIGFRPRSMEVSCHQCKEATAFPEAQLLGLERYQMMRFFCRCGAENHLIWKLMHMKRDDPSG
ncbi:MAG: hypothetical protein ACREE0_21830 [Phenylobacterium sp.]